MIDASIILVSYNTIDFTRQCLKSIYNNVKDISFEVICIDNHSQDGTSEMIKNDFKDVLLIESEENLGYARANNLGISRSTGRYVILLNSDTVVLPGSLEQTIEFMQRNPDAGAASPKLLNPDGSIQYCIRSLPDIKTAFFQSIGWHKLFPGNKITAKYYKIDLDYNKVLSVDSIGTTCYVIRREVLEKVGLLSEDFFLYNVDLDYNKRIKDAGYNIYYLPKPQIIHYGGVSVNQNSLRGLIEQHQGMWRMYRKHYALRKNIFVNCFIFAAIFLRLQVKLILACLSRDKRVIKGPGAPANRAETITSQPAR
jgi:GT2 family glycosyltransferase